MSEVDPSLSPVWSRWGRTDEAGSANEVDRAATLRGLAAVQSGEVISLATAIRPGQAFGLVDRAPATHHMVRSGGDYAAGLPERGGFGYSDDVISLPTQGATHVDALAHVWQDGLMYNGFSANEVTSRGARHLGIEKMPPVVTRGVVIDSAPESLRPAHDPIRLPELQSMLERSRVDLQPGDVLLLRTGWLGGSLRGLAGPEAWAGLDSGCGGWLAERRLALLGSDNPAVEAHPSSDPSCQVPLHVELLRGQGLYFAELMALDELCARRQPTFLFVLAPLPLVGAVGSPVAPVAVL